MCVSVLEGGRKEACVFVCEAEWEVVLALQQ